MKNHRRSRVRIWRQTRLCSGIGGALAHRNRPEAAESRIVVLYTAGRQQRKSAARAGREETFEMVGQAVIIDNAQARGRSGMEVVARPRTKDYHVQR